MRRLEEMLAEQDSRFRAAFAVLEAAIAERAFPGAAVAVTCRGRLLALKGVGRLTYDEAAAPVQATTVYDLASVTKVAATAMAAMLLWERGRLPLELPLAEMVPEFAASAPGDAAGARRGAVTVEHLLAHASGLPAYVKLYEQAEGRAAMVEAACRVPLGARPGERAEYSDVGFLLLGEGLTRLTGERLGEFCHREIYEPLGMTGTRYAPAEGAHGQIPPTEKDAAERVIQGVAQDENARAYAGATEEADAGHAGLFAPARDVALLAECLLRGGEPLLRPETVARFTRRAGLVEGSSRALGWDTPSSPSQAGRYFGPESFGHLGYAGTSVWVDPARRVSVTLLTNRTWPDRSVEAIKQMRPRFHDAVGEGLRWRAAGAKRGKRADGSRGAG